MNTGFIPTPSDYMTVQDFKDSGEWPLPYTSTIGLAPYIRRIKTPVKVLELGTARGEGAVFLLEECPNIIEFVTIDPYLEYKDWNGKIEQDVLDNFRDIAIKNFANFGDKVKQIYKSSFDAVSEISDDTYDVVFIDADHSQDAVFNDILLYDPKVKKGGLIAIHDTNILSTIEGMKLAREKLKVRTPINRVKNGVAFWQK